MDEGPSISGMSDEELKANNLKSQRPNLRLAHFFCVKCRKKPHQWASYGMHVGGNRSDGLSGAGAIHGQLQCHGDSMEILIGFEEANAFIVNGQLIPVFDNENPYHPKRLFDPSDDVLRSPQENGGLILPG